MSERGQVTVSVVMGGASATRWPDLTAALRSLECQTVRADEVIVTTSNPEVAATARAELRGTIVIGQQHGNRAQLRAAAAAVATGTVVAFLDGTASTTWLERLIEPYARPEVLAVGGVVRPQWNAHRPRWLPPQFDWALGCTPRGLVRPRRVNEPAAAAISFRSAALAEVAPAGCKDLDGAPAADGDEERWTSAVCRRLRRGRPETSIVHQQAAEVFLPVSPAHTARRELLARCWAEGRLRSARAGTTGESPGDGARPSMHRPVLASWLGTLAAASGQSWTLSKLAFATYAAAAYVGGRVTGRCAAIMSALALALGGWVAVVALTLAPASLPRAFIVFAFLLLAPGAAVVRRLAIRDAAERLTYAIALSAAISAIVSEVFLLAHAWTAIRAVASVAAVTTALALAPMRRRAGRSAPVSNPGSVLAKVPAT